MTAEDPAGEAVTRSITADPEDQAEYLSWQEHGEGIFLEIGGRWYLAFETPTFDPDDYVNNGPDVTQGE